MLLTDLNATNLVLHSTQINKSFPPGRRSQLERSQLEIDFKVEIYSET